MTPGIKPLIAGNWKMNGGKADLAEIEAMAGAINGSMPDRLDALICLPATLVSDGAGKADGSALAIGGQDCHTAASGAHTGDISAAMLLDAGAEAAIVGHSERRADHGEGDELVRAKAVAAASAGLTAIICVGETKEEREGGKALEVIAAQLAGSLPDETGFVIAYEPVWAIGTGLTATPQDVAQVHAAIRTILVERFGAAGGSTRILYGGSVKPANAGELLAVENVDGALVGGASLKAEDFLAICAACP